MPVPVVEFTDERLSNGLRLIVVEDHLAPVVAVNVWYAVGSKHEVPGKTGFAHLFEHVMFQGSAHVGKAEHMALVQAAGGTLNGTTWLDRTNYYETLPSHQLELALLLEADRMGSLLDALSQENLDNQREVVKNEKRWSYDNRPYGTWNEKLLGHLFPENHPYHHPTIGSMADLDAASLEDVKAFFRDLLRAQQRGALGRGRRAIRAQVRAWAERYFGPIPANPSIPPLPDLSLPRADRRGAARDGRGSRPAAAGVRRLPGAGVRRPPARRAGPRLAAAGRAARGAGCTSGSCATSGWPRTSRCSRCRSSAGRRSTSAGRPSGRGSRSRPSRRRTSTSWSGSPRRRRRADELDRAKALTEADELGALARVEERADRLSMYATLFDDPGLMNTLLPRYLSVTADQIRDAAREVFRADNRVVLTYVPAAADAPDDAPDDAARTAGEVAA